jgi:hypothetical protein
MFHQVGKCPNRFFFDAITRQLEIIEAALNPEDNLEEYSIVSDAELAYWESKI